MEEGSGRTKVERADAGSKSKTVIWKRKQEERALNEAASVSLPLRKVDHKCINGDRSNVAAVIVFFTKDFQIVFS